MKMARWTALLIFCFVGFSFTNAVDNCTGRPCNSNATCTSTVGGFVCACTSTSCTCDPGFTGDGISCTDIDECLINGSCATNATCMNTIGNYNCSCMMNNRSWLGIERFDQCLSTSCHQNATCSSNTRGASCTCNSGFYGDGINCTVLVSTTPLYMTTGAISTTQTTTEKSTTAAISTTQTTTEKPTTGAISSTRKPRKCKPSNIDGFSFNATDLGTTTQSNEICPNNGVARASAVCRLRRDGFIVLSINARMYCNSTIQSLFKQVTTENTTIEVVAQNLQLLTSSTPQLTTEDSTTAAETLQQITTIVTVQNEEISPNLMDNFAITTSTISETQHTMTTLQRNLEIMANRVKLTNKTTFITATNNFDIEVHGTPRNTTNSSVQYSSIGNSTGITIPSEAINQAGRNSNSLKTVLVFYKNDLFFPSTYSNKTNAIDSVTTISFNTDNKITDLKQEVEIAFNSRHNSPPGREKNERFKNNYVEQICVYYDAGTWKSNGCKYAYVNQIPTCRCNHLTSFALLFLNYPVPANVHLELFTIIGCSLSISAFIIAVLLLLLNKKVRKRTSTKMQLHIFCNLAVAYTLFLVKFTKGETGCTVKTILLHYTFLTSWCWMGVFTYKHYAAFVQVIVKETTHYISKISILAYGIPLLIVGVNVGVTLGYMDIENHNKAMQLPPYSAESPPPRKSLYTADNVCWLHGNSLYFGFLLIVGIILATNCIIFVVVLYSVVFKKDNLQSSARKRSKQQNAIIACVLCVSMGVPWVFGYLIMVSSDEKYFQIMSWLFSIFVVSHGILSFYITCIRNEEILNTWFPVLFGCCAKKKETKSTTFDSNTTKDTKAIVTGTTSKL